MKIRVLVKENGNNFNNSETGKIEKNNYYLYCGKIKF